MPEITELEWGWMEINGEHAHGPYPTRGDAIQDAEAYLNPDCKITILVGRCVHPLPENYVQDDLEDVLEHMDRAALDSDFESQYDDVIFDVQESRKSEAQKALTKILQEWAREYIEFPRAWTLEYTEKVKIGG